MSAYRFEPATSDHGKWRDFLAKVRSAGGTKADAQSTWEYLQRCVYWRSPIYQVAVDPEPEHGFGDHAELWHLSIKRNDREPIGDWRVMQKIKNAICGEEAEAIEIYPAESRLVDTCNQYHLWAFMTPGMQVPCGFADRCVVDADDPGPLSAGTKQRPL